MNPGQRVLRGTAIAPNLMAAVWWIWTSIKVTSIDGVAALASSGGPQWVFFTIPPVVAMAALIYSPGNSESKPGRSK